MKLRAFALDYDGTIAQDGVLNSQVRAAIGEARARGLVVALVTGRTLSDLKRVAGDLGFVDAVIAENGAVLSFPNGYSRLIGQPPPSSLLEELRRRGVDFTMGECILEADTASAPEILSAVRDLQLPLVLLFNRSRLMVLPQGVSKSVGLRRALTVLRLSQHNAIGIGDAENDHDLLAACEFGVAVGWGSPALCNVADLVLRGDGPEVVAGFIRHAAGEVKLPLGRMHRYQVALGTTDDGRAMALGVSGRNLLVSGDPRSGKSWITGLMCEKLILQGYSVCVIDPEGDYRTLESLPGVVVFGAEDPPPQLPDVARALRHPDMSVVIDLSHAARKEKIDYLRSLLPMVAAIRRSTGLPHRIVIDEAHYFLNDPRARELLDLDLNAYTLVTYRPSELNADLRGTMDAILVKRITDPRELGTLRKMAGGQIPEAEWKASIRALRPSQAALLPGPAEAEGKLQRFELLPRLTAHVRHKAKYFDLELIEDLGFVFTADGKTLGPAARTLKQFVLDLKTYPVAVLEGHVQRGDFSHWIMNVFHDPALATDVRKIEQRYRLGHVGDLCSAIGAAIENRYELSADKFPAPAVITPTGAGDSDPVPLRLVSSRDLP
jgi:hydroxymethylpyrimidine pyrophosphatase-like HAD family hydrolase